MKHVAVSLGVLIAAVCGTVVLCVALPPLAGAGLAAGLVAFAATATVRALGRNVLAAVCASLLALPALLAVAVAIRVALRLISFEGRLPIPLGLGIAGAAFIGVAFWYLHGDWLGDGRRTPSAPTPEWPARIALPAAVALAAAVILLPPLLVGVLGEQPRAVAKGQRVVSRLDVLIVSGESRAAAPRGVPVNLASSGALGPYAHVAALDVRYSVGFADGDRVRWTLTGSGDEHAIADALRRPDAPAVTAPEPANDADRALVLVVDGTPPVLADPAQAGNVPARAGEVARWRRVARAAAPAGTPTYALLETRAKPRLERWKASFIRRGTHVSRGAAVSLQGLASQAVTDAAVRLAVAAPTAQEDFTLALKHRPILRFDSGEPVPRPLSVEGLLTSGKAKLCRARVAGGTACETIEGASELENGGTHLELPLPAHDELRRLARAEAAARSAATPPPGAHDAPPPATPPAGSAGPARGAGSAIYVHTVPVESEDASLLYLDYWWYLPDNPAESGSGAFCGPGLLIPGISCFDHVSDWEGVTVVLDRTAPGRPPRPIAVHYAQHASVVRYAWQHVGHIAQRPLVYLARGTHAAYPRPCTTDCRQVVGGAEENEHDGALPWIGNTEVVCGEQSCLKMLPTTRGGRDPALWNAFEGPWGKRNCFLTYYCDSSSPPAAPGRQRRYREPWRSDATRSAS